jgi:hypothetical protein
VQQLLHLEFEVLFLIETDSSTAIAACPAHAQTLQLVVAAARLALQGGGKQRRRHRRLMRRERDGCVTTGMTPYIEPILGFN